MGPTVPPELTQSPTDWPVSNGTLMGQRSSTSSAITSSNILDLEVAWLWTIPTTGTFGSMSATPIVVGEMVYLQDMQSNV